VAWLALTAQLGNRLVLVLLHPGPKLGFSTARTWPGPWRSRAEVIITTSAPTMSFLDHVGTRWTPELAASDTLGQA